ncbi:unnamed protein product [Brassica oleracea var. botrytis]
MDPTKQATVMREFQKQSAQMDMTTEMMSDSKDDALDNDEAEDETEDLTNQVLDEIGIGIASQLSSAPKGKIGRKNASENVSSSRYGIIHSINTQLRHIEFKPLLFLCSSEIDELGKRLAALR